MKHPLHIGTDGKIWTYYKLWPDGIRGLQTQIPIDVKVRKSGLSGQTVLGKLMSSSVSSLIVCCVIVKLWNQETGAIICS